MSGAIPYRPSNGSEGADFEASWCHRCAYEPESIDLACDGCEILARAVAFDLGHPQFPAEWISDPDGSNPRCTRFRERSTGTHEQAAADLARYEAAMAEMRASQR